MAKKPPSKANISLNKNVSQTDETADGAGKATESSEDAPQDDSGTVTPGETPDDTKADEESSDDTPAFPDDAPDTPDDAAEHSQTETSADAAADEPQDAQPDENTTSDSAPNAPMSASVPATTPQPAKGPGAGALILGGIVAGAIGFAAAYFGLTQNPPPRDEALVGEVSEAARRLDEQADTIDALTEKVGGIANTDDSALEAQIEALGSLSERVTEAEDTLEAIDARLRDVEQRPVTESADAATIAAYEDELNAAREELAAQREDLQALIDEAMNTETAADEAAVAAMQRAAISRILAALDNGAGFAGSVAELQDTGVDVPEVLVSSADAGVPTLSSLQERFPEAARAALDTSRDATGEGTGLTGFLRSQFGARSLEPREGSDPDAVLSRAEAAIRDGRLQDALAEIEALPEEGRAELSDWAGQAAQRREAVGAAQSLSETLN